MKTSTLKIIVSIFFILFFYNTSSAQIIYTDVIPDTTITNAGGVYHLDLNNDGVIDFDIRRYSSVAIGFGCSGTHTNNFVFITPLDSNEVVDSVYSSFFHVKKLNLNAAIHSSMYYWRNDMSQLVAGHIWGCALHNGNYQWGVTSTGFWYGAVNGYMGLKLIVNGQVYFGWLRMNVSGSAGSFTVKDYAYNSNPNQTILAGSTNTTTVINEISNPAYLSIYPNPFSHTTVISWSQSKNEKISLKIFDINGRLIKTLADNIFEEGDHQIEFNAEKLNAGIYFLKMQTGEFLKTEKLIITK